MRKIYLLLFTIILVLIAANIYYYLSIHRQQVNFQKEFLSRQTEICSWEIEQHTSNFMSEVNYILFTENLSGFFSDPAVMESGSRKIEIFFSKYLSLVTNISVMDENRNVFNVFKDGNNNLVTDLYVSRSQRELHETEVLEKQNGEYIFILPAFSGGQLVANMVVRIDTRKYVESVFANYYIDKTLWQTLVTREGEVIYSTLGPTPNNFSEIGQLVNAWPLESTSGSHPHKLQTEDGLISVISAYYPIRVMQNEMMVIFSLDTSIVISSILTSIITISAATFIVLVIILIVFLYFIKKERQERQQSVESEQSIRDIFESLPTGIMIREPEGKIKMINSTALRILKIDDPESVIGKDLSNMFFLFRDYPGESKTRQRESTSEFVYYDNDENEIILYKKELLTTFLGEEVIVEAFIDISPIEHARKTEFMFGEAKTEFLKRISYDIRNPLNGIMNIAESLGSTKPDPGSMKEQIELIERCCNDIMFVVNDIMDFSGFEESSTLVEEIPFSLAEELEIALASMKKKADEKGLEISVSIDADTPEKFIGDPFHLRQIVTNLVSNSLKYTSVGRIKISACVKKQLAGNIILEFSIEDTGPGIPEPVLENLNTITDRNSIATGGFGLRKTLQLVKLMKGELRLESPVQEPGASEGPGTRAVFTIQIYSNELSGKNLEFSHLKNHKDIRVLVLTGPGEDKQEITRILSEFEIQCEVTVFNEQIINLLKTRLPFHEAGYSILVLPDTAFSNGFAIARALHENAIDREFLIIMTSSVNKPGNFIKSRRFGVDHYLIKPYSRLEIFDIIQANFPIISMPVINETEHKKAPSDLKILIAEDNHVNQIVAISLFKSLGYNPDIATNGNEAVEMVRSKQYDIVFMDIRMPEKSGLDATYEIRRLGYDMPVVAMTANASETDKTQAIEVGMTDFIAKPVQTDIIKKILIKRFSVQGN